MKKGLTLGLAIVTLLVLIASLVACSSSNPAPSTSAPLAPKTTAAPTPAAKPIEGLARDPDIAIGSKFIPSTTYLVAMATAMTLADKAKGYTAHVSCYATSGAFPQSLKSGDIDMSTGTSITMYEPSYGEGDFKSQKPYPIRELASGPMGYYGVIAHPNSGIKTPADLKGKKWMALRPGSILMQQVIDVTLYAYGLTKNDVTLVNQSSEAEIMDALKQGRVDAVSWPFYEGTPWLQELMVAGKAVLIPDTEEAIKKIHDKYPFFTRGVLPAGNYKGQDKDLLSWGAPATLNFRETLSVDQVYDITATLYNNWGTWLKYSESQIKAFQLPGGIDVDLLCIPIHEGAVRYYKEKGYWTAEHEALQKKMLERIAVLQK